MLQNSKSFCVFFCKQSNVSGQNEHNEVEIALRVLQFLSEIKLMITKRFCKHAFDFRPNCTPLIVITIINQRIKSLVYIVLAEDQRPLCG